jgi:hypothetical protein
MFLRLIRIRLRAFDGFTRIVVNQKTARADAPAALGKIAPSSNAPNYARSLLLASAMLLEEFVE